MKIVRNKIHAIVGNDSFLNEETLKRDNLILLFCLSFFIFIPPFLELQELNNLIFDILLSLLIVTGITSLKFRKEKLIRLSYFGLLTLTLIWINFFIDSQITNIVTFIVLIFFLIYITYSMIYNVAQSEKITPILVLNAINSYLLMGIIGSFLFILSNVFYIFTTGIANGTVNFGHTNDPKYFDYIYFGFITLTTVGYGDVIPAIPLTRSLAMLVSLSGQLYLAILVAMLVGKFLSKSKS